MRDHLSSKPATFVEVLRRRARQQPHEPGYTFLTDGDAAELTLTYGELDQRARAVAAWLQASGYSGERALLLYAPGLEYLVAFFGCLYAGTIAVPVYPPRLNQSLLRLQAIAADAQASLALTTAVFQSKIEPLLATELKSLRVMATDSVADEHAQDWQEPALGAEHLAFLQYTSGSTGSPKGVMLSHRNLLHNSALLAEAFEYSSDSHCVSWLPVYHDMGLIGGVLQPLHGGYRCTLMSPASFLQSPFRWLKAITHYKATISGGPNFAYDLCVRKISHEQRAQLDLSSWTSAFNGAEPIRKETLDRFAETFADCGFRREAFYPCYGLAEATLIVTGGAKSALPVIKTIDASGLEQDKVIEASAHAEGSKSLVSSGRSLLQQEIAVVNPNTSTLCLPGHVGEIWVSGPSVAEGYWNNPSETERVFHAQLAGTPSAHYLRTGDLGFMHEGELFVTGRLKDLLIIRGRNLYPQDIESTVARSHPSLLPEGGAAFSVDVAGEERLVIVQEVKAQRDVDLGAVIKDIREAVAKQHEVSAYAVTLIRARSLPKTSSGKIQRHASRDAYLSGNLTVVSEWKAPDATRVDTELLSVVALEPSAAAIEAWLVAQVASSLGVDAAQINAGEPIGRYALDSLQALELTHSIEASLGVSLAVSVLFESASITQLAAQIMSELTAESSSADLLPSRVPEIIVDSPLSYGQRALWFLQFLSPDSTAYNIAHAMRILGPVNATVLRDAFQVLANRHQSLRTTFPTVNGAPVQRIQKHAGLSFSVHDATTWDESDLNARLAVEAERPFKLDEGPLLRVCLYTRAAQDYVLLLVMHHIITDFWSLAVMVHELETIYPALLTGTPATLKAPDFQYSDYVNWQSAMLSGPEGEEHWKYWRGQLADPLPVLDLYTDWTRPPVQTYRGALEVLRIDAELTQSIKAYCEANGATLFMTLLAAFQVLLNRLTGQDDLIVGSMEAGRGRSGLANVVGYFVNPVALRADFSANPTFQIFLQQVRQTVLNSFRHQDYPFALLVERLQPERDASRSPLFDVAFIFQKSHLATQKHLASFALGETGVQTKLWGLDVEPVALERHVSQFDLTLMMAEVNGALSVSFEYNTDLFAAETVKRMGSHYRNLLKSIVAAPEQRISELKLLSESESEQILKQWNATREEGLDGLCIQQMVEETAERSGEAEAVICGEQRLTYRELNERANRLAHYLLEKGVGPEVLVGVMTTRSVEMLIGVLGILKAGGAYLPLDADYPPDRLAYMVEDAGLRLVLANGAVETHGIEVINLLEHKREIDQRSSLNPSCSVGPENLAYVIYTSGSTGRSKGVSVIHRALSNFLNSMRRQPGLGDTDTLLAVTTLSFDIAGLELFLPLIVGARLVIASREEAQDGKRLAEQLERHEVTVMQATPATWRLLLGAGWKGSSRLKMLCGGEALPLDLAEQLLGAGSSLWNMYGPTETTIWSAVSKVESLNRTVPIGGPIANTELYVVDKQLAPVPVGVVGELLIGGDGLATGYLNHPALTAERFIPDPFSEKPGARFYRTGDQARFLPNGQIEFLGRFDNQVKVRGFRIELGEIEARLLELAGVREAVVIVSEDQTGEKELVAYVVPEAQQETTAKQMRDYLSEKLPEYMLPMWYVMLPEMPLTLNGKVDRKALPPPSRSRLDLPGRFVPPRTPKEEIIANIWSQVLQIDQLSVYDNFFELGGHSLRATQVISRLREVFQVELPPHSLFKSPTIAGLSEILAAITQTEPGLPLVPVNRTGPLPLSFAQQRIWFMDQLERGNTVFNMLVGFRLQGSLKVEALEQALNEIVRRHEVLRTVFIDAGGEPLQSIDPIRQTALRTFDLTGLSGSEHDTETQRLAIEETERPFDLAHGPLLRASLLHLNEQEHVLLAATHHIVSDGWSLGIFVRELCALYEAFSKDQPSPLETPPIQYVDYAYWQSQSLQGAVLDQELAYWKQRLAGAPPLLELPFARPRPAVRTHGCAHQHLQLPQDLAVSLRALSQREGVTLFMTLMAAFQALLCYYSGQNDVVVGTDVANRNRVETEKLIGLFVNQIVMRTDLSGDPTFSELLARVREVALGAYAHQEIPFEKLVEALKPKRSLSHTPLFQILFTLQNMPEQPFELSDLTVRLMDVEPRATKYDLTFFMHETEQGLAGSLEYNIDLFDATSSARITGDFEMLLRYVASRPDARLSVLKEVLTENERQQEKMKRTEHKVFGLESFKSIKPKAVNLSPKQLVKTSYLQPGSTLPLVFQPEIEDVDPAEWAGHNLKFIESSLLQHGALLFRGFDVRDAPRFERFACAIRPDLFNENGEHPREQVAGNVYTPVFYPPEEQLLWHNENSFNYRWPAKIWFCCLQAPTEGGETPIVDSRKVYNLIDPKIRQRFEEKKVMYVRNHWKGFGLSWQTLFRTTDKSVVEDQCRKAGIEFEWKENDGLITRQVRPAVIRHPQTGEMSWFNQIQHWHISCLKPAVRRSLLSQFKEEDLPRHAYYGDGSPIEDSVMAEILEVYRQLEVSFPWQANDILLVDNISTAHGRNPFVGKRTMLVAMAEMLSYADV